MVPEYKLYPVFKIMNVIINVEKPGYRAVNISPMLVNKKDKSSVFFLPIRSAIAPVGTSVITLVTIPTAWTIATWEKSI